MKKISVFFRVIYIQYIWFKYGLDDLLTQHHRLYMFRFLIYFNPFFWFRPQLDRAVAIRTILENLGPLFIKFGQALSTRPDVLPADIAFELSKLQDKVPLFQVIKLLIFYKRPIKNHYMRFFLNLILSLWPQHLLRKYMPLDYFQGNLLLSKLCVQTFEKPLKMIYRF